MLGQQIEVGLRLGCDFAGEVRPGCRAGVGFGDAGVGDGVVAGRDDYGDDRGRLVIAERGVYCGRQLLFAGELLLAPEGGAGRAEGFAYGLAGQNRPVYIRKGLGGAGQKAHERKFQYLPGLGGDSPNDAYCAVLVQDVYACRPELFFQNVAG